MLNHRRVLIFLLPVCLLFFSLVNPTQGSSAVVVAGSILIALAIYICMLLFVKSMTVLTPISLKSQKHLALAATSFIVFLLLMQSIGQLSFRDALAVLALIAISYLYISYPSRTRKNSGK